MILFKPVTVKKDQYQISENLPSWVFYKNLSHVLKYYDIPHQVDAEDKIWVSSTTWEDLDLMWNYTLKARDSTWLNSHPLEELNQ